MAKQKATNTPARSKHKDEAQQHIVRLWGDVEVVDATKDLRVFIRPEDVASATRKDPGCCVFAQACKRTFDASKILFFRSVAYVELPNEDGRRRVERFFLNKGMRELIESFDRGEPVIPEAGFVLKAVPRMRKLENRRKYKKELDRRRLRGEAVGGEKRGRQGEGKYAESPLIIDMAVRSGTGAVHFTKKKEAEAG